MQLKYNEIHVIGDSHFRAIDVCFFHCPNYYYKHSPMSMHQVSNHKIFYQLGVNSESLIPKNGLWIFCFGEIEVRCLIYNQINPLSQVISSSKEIVRLGSEITFETGSATLTADGKQKISLGRGLVRSDVNVIMFDEPLTVIDPHLKWVLRSKLKELHQKINRTMIYVTHDQIEALTFADQVVVMHEGQIVQTGTPVELFEKPKHTFVGHFIGSPGMNILPCEIKNGQITVNGQALTEAQNAKYSQYLNPNPNK